MAQPRKARFSLAFIWGIAGFCLFGLIALFFRGAPTAGDAYEEKRAADRSKLLAELQEEAHQKLTQPAVIDKEKGIYRIPIELAMQITLKELIAKGVSPSAEKVEIVPSLLVPPYLKPATDASTAEEAAPAKETAPEAAAPATPAAAESPAAPAPEAAPASPAGEPEKTAVPSEN